MSQHDADYKVSEYDSYTCLEQYLLNNLQKEFPLSPCPFDEIASRYDVEPEVVMTTFEKLQSCGAISRIGPVIKPNAIGSSILAALQVADAQLLQIAEMINAYPEVNHNYERDHHYNLWFVVIARDKVRLDFVLDEIEEKTGCPMLRLPLLDAYHIDLGFDLKCN